MKAHELTSVDGNQYLTVEEAASFLGIKENALRNYLSLGKVALYKFKSLTLLKKEEMLDWKNNRKRK